MTKEVPPKPVARTEAEQPKSKFGTRADRKQRSRERRRKIKEARASFGGLA